MIVLLAHQADPFAPALAGRVAGVTGRRVGVLTPRDLSRPGWALASPPDGRTDRLIVDGEPVAASSVELIVSLLEEVLPEELVWIREDDTEYVAAEMTALLRFLLDSVSGRVFIPPGALSLAGPDPPVSAWAAAGGVPAAGARPRGGDGFREVSVVAERATGAEAPSLRRSAVAMARWAGVPWLRAYFAQELDEVVAVVPLPSLAESTEDVAAVIAEAHRVRGGA